MVGYVVNYIVFLLLIRSYSCEENGKYGLCANAECTEPIAEGYTLQPYSAPEKNILSFEPNVEVKIYVTDCGKKKDYYGVELNGKKGYVPKKMISERKKHRDAKFYAKHEFLYSDVAVKKEKELNIISQTTNTPDLKTPKLPDNTETVKIPDNTETVKLPDNTETVKLPDNTETVKLPEVDHSTQNGKQHTEIENKGSYESDSTTSSDYSSFSQVTSKPSSNFLTPVANAFATTITEEEASSLFKPMPSTQGMKNLKTNEPFTNTDVADVNHLKYSSMDIPISGSTTHAENHAETDGLFFDTDDFELDSELRETLSIIQKSLISASSMGSFDNEKYDINVAEISNANFNKMISTEIPNNINNKYVDHKKVEEKPSDNLSDKETSSIFTDVAHHSDHNEIKDFVKKELTQDENIEKSKKEFNIKNNISAKKMESFPLNEKHQEFSSSTVIHTESLKEAECLDEKCISSSLGKNIYESETTANNDNIFNKISPEENKSGMKPLHSDVLSKENLVVNSAEANISIDTISTTSLDSSFSTEQNAKSDFNSEATGELKSQDHLTNTAKILPNTKENRFNSHKEYNVVSSSKYDNHVDNSLKYEIPADLQKNPKTENSDYDKNTLGTDSYTENNIPNIKEKDVFSSSKYDNQNDNTLKYETRTDFQKNLKTENSNHDENTQGTDSYTENNIPNIKENNFNSREENNVVSSSKYDTYNDNSLKYETPADFQKNPITENIDYDKNTQGTDSYTENIKLQDNTRTDRYTVDNDKISDQTPFSAETFLEKNMLQSVLHTDQSEEDVSLYTDLSEENVLSHTDTSNLISKTVIHNSASDPVNANFHVNTPENVNEVEEPGFGFPFFSIVNNTASALSSLLDTIIYLLPEPVYSYLVELHLAGISKRAVVFTAIFSLPCSLLFICHIYLKEHSKEKQITAQLVTTERNLYIASAEKNVLEEEIDMLKEQLSKITSELAEKDMQIADFSVNLEDICNKHENKLSELELLQSKFRNLRKQSEDYASTINKLESLLKDYSEKNEFLSEQLSEAENLLKNKEKLLAELNEDIHVLENAKRELTDVTNESTMKISQLEESCNQLLQEAEIWNARVNELNSQLCNELLIKRELETSLENKENEIMYLRDSFKDLSVLQELKDSGEADEKSIEKKLMQLLDVSAVNEKLKSAEMNIESLSKDLKSEKNKTLELEVELLEAKSETEKLKLSYNRALQDKTEAQTKLDVLSNYFKDKEMQLQKELGAQEAVRQQKEESATHAERQMYLLEEENASYKYQVATLKQELEDTERNLKNQISAQEKKAHESWLAARSAERKLEEVKQEGSQLRQKLALLERGQETWTVSSQDDDEIIRPIPKRFPITDSETGSRTSPSTLEFPSQNLKHRAPELVRPLPPHMIPSRHPLLPPPPPLPHLPGLLPFLPRMDHHIPPRHPHPWHLPFERNSDLGFSAERQNTPVNLSSSETSVPDIQSHSSFHSRKIVRQTSPPHSFTSQSSQHSTPSKLPQFHNIPPRPYLPPPVQQPSFPPSVLHQEDQDHHASLFRRDILAEGIDRYQSKTNLDISRHSNS